MLRRFLVILIRRSLIVLLLVCLGCVAQSAPPDIARKIEHQVRAFYTIPAEVKVTVGAITPSTEMPGYDAVAVNIDGGDGKQKDYKFLLSTDRATMLRVTKFDLTKDPFAEVMSKIDITGRPSRGAKSAKVVAVNFDDFECPFCSRMHQTLFPEIFKEYGDRVEFIYKDDPLTEIHPWALHAAVDANCLAAQNNDAYWELADYLHANQHVINSNKAQDAQFDAVDRATLLAGQQHNVDVVKLHACIKTQNDDAVKASIHEGDALGVQATPTLFVNGEEMDGALPLSEVRAVLDRALTNAGVQPPTHAEAAPAPVVTNPPSK